MRFDLTTPCAQCPFRSDVRPYIKAERVEEILIGNQSFACHKTLDKDHRIHANSQHCAGVLIILEREERPHQMMRIAERLGFYDLTKLRMSAPVYASISDAITAHVKADP